MRARQIGRVTRGLADKNYPLELVGVKEYVIQGLHRDHIPLFPTNPPVSYRYSGN